jgi:hypothetical protein
MFVVCCQVEVLRRADNLSKRSLTDCGASMYVIKKPRVTKWPRKKRTEPLGNACSKNQLSNLGQNKITNQSLG